MTAPQVWLATVDGTGVLVERSHLIAYDWREVNGGRHFATTDLDAPPRPAVVVDADDLRAVLPSQYLADNVGLGAEMARVRAALDAQTPTEAPQ